ncbi:DUF1835 domain-containing protein [Thalassospira povalilytica]|uniref:DUF1835 domain-containing protein n=1 Tax=Thalassospira povalilytica TaxID=732237 RepID=A0A8I1M885_9PROT|nr:DUF1835 domain-containing protein [Thalassospira povalilytica]MBN8196710.1 DUF1835 domain-containing protein [Thalassospira povalilytica]
MSASRTTKSDKAKSSRPNPIFFDGRLNLEQQRKRAKDLLRALRAGNQTAQQRFVDANHPIGAAGFADIRLADAQLVIARENGFASWPKLKNHIDRITEQNRQISSGNPPVLDTKRTLHLRCGSDIRNGLGIAGFVGDFLEFADPFCQGPVPDLPLDEFISVRADFIASGYHITPKDALARSKREYAALNRLDQYDHVVLWFEHDGYDQLILAFLMDFIATAQPATRIELISVGAIPGVERFIGLGQLSPELLIWCWENHRVSVTDAMLETGRTAWKAIRSATPEALEKFVQTATSALPHLIPALERHIAELPDPQSGLGLTQKLVLQIARDHGPLPVGKIYAHLMRSYDPLPYLADLMFWSEIQTMMHCKSPLFTLSDNPDQHWPTRILTITATGSDTLAGNQNFLDNFTTTRWVGGIEITPETGGVFY